MTTRPNILVIYTDQQRGDALGADGNPAIQTPILDGIATSGTRFSNHFVQHPLCMPSRISMLAGQYPSTLGITQMGVPVPEHWTLLPHVLASVGYRCANIGKLHFLPHANRDHRRPHPSYGFDHVEISDEPGVYPDAYTAWLDLVAPGVAERLPVGRPLAKAVWHSLMEGSPVDADALGRDDYATSDPWPHRDGLTHSAFVAERTIEVLRARPANEPLFCVAGFFSPHSPFHVPARFLDQYDRDDLPLPKYPPEIERQRAADPTGRFSDEHLRLVKHGYYGAVTEVDHHVGRILDALADTGRLDNTVVVVTSDHGEWLGDHLRYAKGDPGDDAITRVPLLVSGAPVEQGLVIDDVVEAVDIAPTICELAGLQSPPWFQGTSLAGRLRGEPAPVGEFRPARTETSGWKSLRTERFRYIIRSDGTESLWDLDADPGEYRDLALLPDGDTAATLGALRHELLAAILNSERPRPRAFPY